MKSARCRYFSKCASAIVITWITARAARPKAVAQRLEVAWPVALAHRLEHLDRDDAVEFAADVAIVLQAQVDAAGDASVVVQATPRVAQLFRRQA